MKRISILSVLFFLGACSTGEETVYEKFAGQYLNDPSKYEFISADTIDFIGLLSIEYELGSQYANLETSIQRAFDLMGTKNVLNAPDQCQHVADSILSLKPEELFPGKSQCNLELIAQFEGIQNRVKIEQSRFESMLAPYQKTGRTGVIYVDHKYRTSSDKGKLILEEALLMIDTTTNELIFAKVIK